MTEESVSAAAREDKLAYLDKMMSRALMASIDNFVREDKDVPDRHSTERFLIPAAAWFSFRSVERQERLMNDMHDQSKTMLRLTKCIKGLTVAVVVLTAVVLVVAALQVGLLVYQVVRG